MIRLSKKAYKRIFFSTTAIIFILAIVPNDGIDLDVDYADKIKHIFAFFTLSFLLNKATSTVGHRVRNIFILLSFGILIEVVQMFLPYRESSVADVYADLTGILIFQLALSAYRFYLFKKGLYL